LVARAREVAGFDCDESFGAAAARVIEVRAAEVFEHSRGVLDLDRIERVHDMRVATRRLRAALEVFQPCFPEKRWRKALKRVKALADALGERRDRDVAIEFLDGLAATLPAPDRERLGELIAAIEDERRSANDSLEPLVEPTKLRKLERRLRELVEAAER
jgi:CHAD domain-containing protein